MPELRENPATKRWVIIATERAKRPEDFKKNVPDAPDVPPYDAKCPFCEGNEALSGEEIFAIGGVRVIPNKYPMLVPPAKGSPTEPKRHKSGIYLHMEGVGKHELVIEGPAHNKCIATMSVDEVSMIIRAYQERYLALDWDPSYKLVTIFKNHGPRAGASQQHAHSQIVATSFIPLHVRYAIGEAQRYYDELGRCVYCDMIKSELSEKERLVTQNGRFVAFVPYAAMLPYEVCIIPLRHSTTFADLQQEDIEPLAQILHEVLAKFYRGMNNPDLNYIIRTVPHHSACEPYYHWHIQVLPRLTTPAGFEIGSGITVNVALPEESAKFLREFKL